MISGSRRDVAVLCSAWLGAFDETLQAVTDKAAGGIMSAPPFVVGHGIVDESFDGRWVNLGFLEAAISEARRLKLTAAAPPPRNIFGEAGAKVANLWNGFAVSIGDEHAARRLQGGDQAAELASKDSAPALRLAAGGKAISPDAQKESDNQTPDRGVDKWKVWLHVAIALVGLLLGFFIGWFTGSVWNAPNK